jgi:hypothetical protein
LTPRRPDPYNRYAARGSGRSSVVEHLLPKHPSLSGVRQIAVRPPKSAHYRLYFSRPPRQIPGGLPPGVDSLTRRMLDLRGR